MINLVIFLNYHNAYDVIKKATLHRTLCDVVWRHKDISTDPHCTSRENLLYTTILISFVVQYVCVLVLYQTFPCIGSSGSRYDMFKTDCALKCRKIYRISASRASRNGDSLLYENETVNFVLAINSKGERSFR